MSKSMLLENYARKITDIASENLGEEIVLLDTGEISLFSEFSILITGQTDRHLESLSQKIMREMKKNGKKIHKLIIGKKEKKDVLFATDMVMTAMIAT